MSGEYWIILIPVFFAITVIIYFIYHIWHTEKYSSRILKSIISKIEDLEEEKETVPLSKNTQKLIVRFKRIQQDNDLNLFELERELGIDMHTFEKKITKELENQEKYRKKAQAHNPRREEEVLTMNEQGLKKEIYRQLALSVFGNLIGYGEKENIVAKTMYFVTDPTGDFYLLSRKNEEIEDMNTEKTATFFVLKEEEVVSKIKEIKIKGKTERIQTDSDEWKQGLSLFEEKSPYIGNLTWLEDPRNYIMFKMKSEEISYHHIGHEKEGEKNYLLIRKGE
jgi:hypothetical protein